MTRHAEAQGDARTGPVKDISALVSGHSAEEKKATPRRCNELTTTSVGADRRTLTGT
jgi:hypothetical protein